MTQKIRCSEVHGCNNYSVSQGIKWLVKFAHKELRKYLKKISIHRLHKEIDLKVFGN